MSARLAMRCRGYVACSVILFTMTGCVKSGGDQGSTSSADANAPSVPAVSSSSPVAAPVNAAPREVSFTITTNVYGAMVVVKDNESGGTLQTHPFERGQYSTKVKLPGGKAYDFVVRVGDVSVAKAGVNIDAESSLSLMFDPGKMNDVRKAATCLLNIPGGGFGSGFLLGDRQTIATAAHCVACRNVEEMEIVFHPAEAKRKKVTGARLIYFDAEQDVALLHLSEPMEETRPYFWRAEPAKEGDEVAIMGNPGRGGEPDPMYSRSGKVKGTRPDEFFLDIELKPGYSGGPVARTSSMDALGITSYKIMAARDYRNVGQSFAKSVDIAADAFEFWRGLDSSGRASKLEREQDRYTRRYGYFMADQASKAMLIDSAIYAWSCVEVVEDYVRKQNIEISKLRNLTPARYNKALKDFHNDYLKIHGPKQAEKTRERLSPRLRMQSYFGEIYKQALADEHLPAEIKTHLEKTFEHYTNIKEAAEKVVDPSGKSKKGKTLEEFILWVIEEYEGAVFHAEAVMEETEGRVE